ncbi:hypothetical protein LX36DRAFT_329609 [Colletotrichum falcatum]|nr:hypothetical protein LX36DRAFT_329609 [Colletotrichum falcatum]
MGHFPRLAGRDTPATHSKAAEPSRVPPASNFRGDPPAAQRARRCGTRCCPAEMRDLDDVWGVGISSITSGHRRQEDDDFLVVFFCGRRSEKRRNASFECCRGAGGNRHGRDRPLRSWGFVKVANVVEPWRRRCNPQPAARSSSFFMRNG